MSLPYTLHSLSETSIAERNVAVLARTRTRGYGDEQNWRSAPEIMVEAEGKV